MGLQIVLLGKAQRWHVFEKVVSYLFGFRLALVDNNEVEDDV